MMLFVDCHYTDLDDGELISVGMVSKNLKHEFYAERMHDWFETLPKKITLAGTSLIKLNLMWDALGGKIPSNTFTHYYLRQLNRSRDYHEGIRKYHEIEGQSSFHALHAAHAKRAGWLAWENSHHRWLELQRNIKQNSIQEMWIED